jgi:hypothetical protein
VVAASDEAGLTTSPSSLRRLLLVDPTLLTLARQRGELDCGGLRHVIVATAADRAGAVTGLVRRRTSRPMF